GVQYLKNSGDVYQYGGAWLCEGGICPTSDGKANLISIDIPDNNIKAGGFKLLMRRGKQFNSMVYGDKDAFHEIGRYDALIHKGIYENFAEMPDYTVDVKLEKADHFNANKDRQYYERPVADLEDNPN